jgi:hypothetical protein
MNWIQKLDTFWRGLAIGLFFPVFCFFCYWLFLHSQIDFPRGFIKYLMGGQLLSNVVKLCCLGNLLLFYFGLTKKIDGFTKGIITSVVLYVGLVAYISYFLETDFS